MTTTKFAVLNPSTGEYVYAEDFANLKDVIAQIAWEFYLLQTQNTPYTVISINEDGSESWASPTGEPVLSPAEIAAILNRKIPLPMNVTEL